jgi:hypothetical protein
MIRHHSRHSLLWRCIPAFQLATHVSTTDPEPLLELPLRELFFWERGGRFERITGPQSPLTTLRLTVDFVGISKVERLPRPPPYAGECTSRAAFIVQDEASILGVMAQLKVRRRMLSSLGTTTPTVLFLSLCRTDACVSASPLGHRRPPSGTLAPPRAWPFAKRIPRTLLHARLSMLLKWTR